MYWFLLVLLLSLAGHASAATPLVGETAPEWTATGPVGHVITFTKGPRARPAILLFWATWCPYCRALMPHVQRVLDDMGPQALDVYALDIFEDENADPMGELRARGQNFILITPGDAVAERYGVMGTPALFLVDRNGRVSYIRPNNAGPDQVEATLRTRLSNDVRDSTLGD